MKSFAPRPEGKKVIALTFDDGPSIYSDKILDILKQNKVKATFFELGEQSLEFPKVEQRIVREGHQ
ncbi:polysaccharide deacetylase family protein, partial [Erysipelatoclostridium ramosum]|nr:polysaccharide deacetylase family protein [Thomasclavelia ramosa]